MASSKKRRQRKMIVFVVELIVIVAMITVLYFVIKLTDKQTVPGETVSNSGPLIATVDDIPPAEIGISETVQEATEEGGAMHGYLNIALFGIDALSTSTNDLLKGYRSDCIIIASINQNTGDIKLCSVYRDTYLNLSNDSYNKCNGAYAKGGATQAISMLNANMDLDITNWVSISYKALRETIDGLGGVEIDIDSEELRHINNYQISICESLGISTSSYTPVTQTGRQTLDGLQASAYCRIRYTAGDDFKRTERQREVIKAIQDKAKKTDLATLTEVFNSAIGDVYTSLSVDTMMDLLANIAKYNIVDENGFPNADMRTTGTIGIKGSCVVPLNLESNVVWLHKFLFDDENYEASETVKEYSAKVKADTSSYVGR